MGIFELANETIIEITIEFKIELAIAFAIKPSIELTIDTTTIGLAIIRNNCRINKATTE